MMKRKMGVPQGRPLAVFLPTISIKAKDFAAEMTSVNMQSKDLQGETAITHEHVDSNAAVRKMLTERGIVPENLPPADTGCRSYDDGSLHAQRYDKSRLYDHQYNRPPAQDRVQFILQPSQRHIKQEKQPGCTKVNKAELGDSISPEPFSHSYAQLKSPV